MYYFSGSLYLLLDIIVEINKTADKNLEFGKALISFLPHRPWIGYLNYSRVNAFHSNLP